MSQNHWFVDEINEYPETKQKQNEWRSKKIQIVNNTTNVFFCLLISKTRKKEANGVDVCIIWCREVKLSS